MNKEEANELAKELCKLTLDVKQKNSRIKDLKAKIWEYMDLEKTISLSFPCDDGYYADFNTETVRELVDIPVKVKVEESVMTDEQFEDLIKVKTVLSRKARKLLLKGDEDLRKLTIPKTKRTVKIKQGGE